jgi:hypothetical protein
MPEHHKLLLEHNPYGVTIAIRIISQKDEGLGTMAEAIINI